MERVPRNRPGPYADPSGQRPCDECRRGRRPAGTYFRRTDRHAGTRRTADEDRVPEYPTEDGSQGSFRAISLIAPSDFPQNRMLSGCLQRAVCSDPLSSDIREKSDGPTTSAGSAFRNFVLDRASYDETHGTEYTDADSSRPPPSSSSSKYPQTKAASEPIRTNSETESTASSKYAKRYIPACRAFITNFTSLI